MKNPFRFNAAVLVSGSWLSAISAQAHPGHGPDDGAATHLILSPDHLGTCLVVAVLVFCLLHALRRRHDANPR